MKKLVTILALATTVIASPAFAKTSANAADQAPAVHQQSSNTVSFDGKRGQDPDPYVRLQILRDQEAGHA